jgi:hypothetical protein
MKLATLVAFAAVAACPAYAATLTVTAGCTGTFTNFTSTLFYSSTGITDPAGIATITSPNLDAGTNPGCGASNFLSENTGQSDTILFSQPVANVGFVWGTPDAYNTFQIFSGTTLLGSYNGANITSILAAGAYYTDFAASNITSVVFSSSNCCFETEHFSYELAAVPEPSTFFPLVIAATWLAFWLRRRSLR